jgi:pseudouridine synthase
MTNVRLNKYLSECEICSRRKADEHILAGKVFVNDKKADLGQKIDPKTDRVEFNGEPVEKNNIEFIYYALNKPRGVISTASDEIKRKSVIDFVPKERRVYPVGRLDKDSEGLILLTNDGELTQELTHPSSQHEKEYFVKAVCQKGKEVSIANLTKRFLNGISVEGKIMKADKVGEGHESPDLRHFSFLVTIHTGYNRQIRKMCDKIGLEVIKLKRVRIGKLKLSDLNLEPGEYKAIKKEEII